MPKLSSLVLNLLNWFAASARDLPWRRTNDPYAIWVSEIMLQQTQVKTVIPYYERWMKQFPTVAALATARPDRVLKLWEGLGYYTRARNLHRASEIIVREHGGRFPLQFKQILSLPGIGRYTAGAICSIAYNQPTPILDGNVIRVLARSFAVEGNPRERAVNEQLWNHAEKLVRVALSHAGSHLQACSHLNQSLMELGALVCLPRDPHCTICPLRKHCLALREGRAGEFPQLPRRVQPVEKIIAAFVLRWGNRYLVRQRPIEEVNGGLWEFPNVEAQHGFDPSELAERWLNAPPLQWDSIATIRHTITRHRLTTHVFATQVESGESSSRWSGVWRSFSQLERLAFPSAHRQIVRKLPNHQKRMQAGD